MSMIDLALLPHATELPIVWTGDGWRVTLRPTWLGQWVACYEPVYRTSECVHVHVLTRREDAEIVCVEWALAKCST